MSWGIAETAPEIEKIKAESADYLGGLNSCGEIEWGIYSQAFDFYADLIQKAYELGKTEAKPHWIPCSESLPEDEQPILFSTTTGRVHQGRFHRDNSVNRWYSSLDKMRAYNNVVNAWMPLPEPYREE